MEMLTTLGFEPLDGSTLVLRASSGNEQATLTVRQEGEDYTAVLAAHDEGGIELRFTADDIRDIAAFATAVQNEVHYRDQAVYPDDDSRIFEFQDVAVLNPFADLTYGDWQCLPRTELGYLTVIHPASLPIRDAYLQWRDAKFVTPAAAPAP